MSCGADIVVQSTHKTLTSLSQTGMMHFGRGKYVLLNLSHCYYCYYLDCYCYYYGYDY